MSQLRAAVASALHFVTEPGVVVGLVPWLLTRWQVETLPSYWFPLRGLGAVAACLGVVVIGRQFVRFVVEGEGSPAPAVPTERLVVGGLYRWVRNPMYVAVIAAIFGQALWFGSPWLAVYGLVMAGLFVAFVRWYEEPALARQHGSAYDEYRRRVPAWIPRRRALESAGTVGEPGRS